MASSTHGGKRAGAGRKAGPLGRRVNVALRLPEQVAEALSREAEARDITRTEAIERAVLAWLRRVGVDLA